MRWRTGESSKLEKLLGALQMGIGGAMIGFMFSPWGDRHISPESKPYLSLLAAGFIAHGRYNFHGRHAAATSAESIAYMHAKAQEHEPKIRSAMEQVKSIADYVVPRAQQAYHAMRNAHAYAR